MLVLSRFRLAVLHRLVVFSSCSLRTQPPMVRPTQAPVTVQLHAAIPSKSSSSDTRGFAIGTTQLPTALCLAERLLAPASLTPAATTFKPAKELPAPIIVSRNAMRVVAIDTSMTMNCSRCMSEP